MSDEIIAALMAAALLISAGLWKFAIQYPKTYRIITIQLATLLLAAMVFVLGYETGFVQGSAHAKTAWRVDVPLWILGTMLSGLYLAFLVALPELLKQEERGKKPD